MRADHLKTKIMASSPISSCQIDGETVADFIFWVSKIVADGDCSHEINRRLPGEGNGNPLSIPAWRIPWTEELCGLAHGVARVGHDWVSLTTSLSWSPWLQTGFLRPKGLFLQSDPGQDLTVHPAFCVSLGCSLRRVTFSPLPSSFSAPWRYTRADSPIPSSKVTFKTKNFGFIWLMTPCQSWERN